MLQNPTGDQFYGNQSSDQLNMGGPWVTFCRPASPHPPPSHAAANSGPPPPSIFSPSLQNLPIIAW